VRGVAFEGGFDGTFKDIFNSFLTEYNTL